jgi:hypothetical protein
MRVALVLAGLALAAAPTMAATGRASVQSERMSARLVLEWQRPVGYTVTQSDGYVFIRFTRPFPGPLDKVHAPLARYVAELRLAGGGRVLVMRLAGRPYFAHRQRGNAVVLTWIGAAPAEYAASEARAAPEKRAASEKRAAAARTATARRPSAAENPTDSGEPQARARQNVVRPQTADRTEPPKRPAAPPALRASRVPAEPPDSADVPKARPRDGGPFTETLLPPPRPTAPPDRAAPPAPPPPERDHSNGPALKSPGTAGEALPQRPAPPPEKHAERPVVAQPEPLRPAAPAAPRAENARPLQAMAKAPAAPPQPPPEVRPAPEARPAPDGPLEPPVMPAISPTLNVTSDGAETRIALAWPEPVAAAVFRHGGHLWMVFPRREAFDLQKVQRQFGPGVESLTRVEHAQATLLAVQVRPDMRVRVAHERNVWTIALKPGNGTPALPDVKLAISRNGIEQAALPLPGAETPIRFVAPETGSVLHVVPSRASAAAGGERAFVTFRILPAAQGGVIEALADGLVVGAERGAITIRRAAGLLLSNGGPSREPQGQN